MKAGSQKVDRRHLVTTALTRTLPVTLAELELLAVNGPPAQQAGQGLGTQPYCVLAINHVLRSGADQHLLVEPTTAATSVHSASSIG
jgi:hypothetical protein